MPRKNYNTKQARKRHEIPWLVEERSADYSVLMTNNSGVKRITITANSSVSAWTYATRLGVNEDDTSMPGTWWPIEVSRIGDNDETFTVIHSTF